MSYLECRWNNHFWKKLVFLKYVFGIFLDFFFLDTGFLCVSSKGFGIVNISFFKLVCCRLVGQTELLGFKISWSTFLVIQQRIFIFWVFWWFIWYVLVIDCFSTFNFVFKILRRIQILNFLPLTSHWEEVQHDGEKSKSFFKQKWWKERFSSGDCLVNGLWWVSHENTYQHNGQIK